MQFKATQASGTGLALVSALAPTLGIELPYSVRLIGVGIGMVMLVWPIISLLWNEFRSATPTLKAFFVCCLIPVVAIWGMAWLTTPNKTTPPVVPASPSPMPSPSPTPAQTTATPVPVPQPKPPPPPPKPWVSTDNQDKQRKLGRTLLVYSPSEIIAMYANGQDISIFVGKWIRIEGSTINVPVETKLQNKDYYYVIGVQLDPINMFNRANIAAFFDSKKYGDVLLSMKPGSGIQAVCQFNRIEKQLTSTVYNINVNTLVALNCEAP